jgi:hypothetical protein
MSDPARATEVLLEVMGVVGEDALLPLPVLLNLHRAELQAPAENLGLRLQSFLERWPESTDRLPHLLNRLNLEWPTLRNGSIFREDTTLNTIATDATTHRLPEEFDRHMRAEQPGLYHLLGSSLGSWFPYEPLALLHQITWPEANREGLIAMLERELALDPAVERIIRHYARTDNWDAVVR